MLFYDLGSKGTICLPLVQDRLLHILLNRVLSGVVCGEPLHEVALGNQEVGEVVLIDAGKGDQHNFFVRQLCLLFESV